MFAFNFAFNVDWHSKQLAVQDISFKMTGTLKRFKPFWLFKPNSTETLRLKTCVKMFYKIGWICWSQLAYERFSMSLSKRLLLSLISDPIREMWKILAGMLLFTMLILNQPFCEVHILLRKKLNFSKVWYIRWESSIMMISGVN